MAITNLHVRFLWGAFDLSTAQAQTPSYVGATQYATLGPAAVGSGGIGVRRVTLRFDRTMASPADDDQTMHFDFLNITGGNPDDTWITSDFTTLEGLINTWWGATTAYAASWSRLSRLSWHRVGPGIPQPNAAERILDIASPAQGTASTVLPPQVASSITLRTGLRKHWGRTYFPLMTSFGIGGRVSATAIAGLVSATVTMLHGAMTADFHPVVYSKTLNSALGVEAVEVDDTADIVRRRRWKHTVNKTVTAL